MNLTRLLRFLVSAYIILGVAFLVAEFTLQESLPTGLRDVELAAPVDFYPILAGCFAVILTVAMVTGWIGLWFLWNPARYIYTAALFAAWVTKPLLGASLSTALGGTFLEGAQMVAGAILVLIFCTEIQQKFKQTKSEQGGDGDAEEAV